MQHTVPPTRKLKKLVSVCLACKTILLSCCHSPCTCEYVKGNSGEDGAAVGVFEHNPEMVVTHEH